MTYSPPLQGGVAAPSRKYREATLAGADGAVGEKSVRYAEIYKDRFADVTNRPARCAGTPP